MKKYDAFFRPGKIKINVLLLYSPPDSGITDKLIENFQIPDDKIQFNALSTKTLSPGEIYREQFVRWLNEADFILLFVSDTLLQLDQTDVELAWEQRNRGSCTLIPVLIDKGSLGNSPIGQIEPIRLKSDRYGDFGLAVEIFNSLSELVTKVKKQAPDSAARQRFKAPSRDAVDLRSFNSFAGNTTTLLTAIALISIGLCCYSKFSAGGYQIEAGSSSLFAFDVVVVSAASMSIIQTYRRLNPIRGSFHQAQLSAWLTCAAMEEIKAKIRPDALHAMFDLPIELLTGQISALAEQALDDERRLGITSSLILCLTQEPLLRQSKLHPNEPLSGQIQDRGYAIQRNLDQFQIMSSSAWRRKLLSFSMFVSSAFFASGLTLFSMGQYLPHGETRFEYFSYLFIGTAAVGSLAGFLSTALRDCLAIIEKARR